LVEQPPSFPVKSFEPKREEFCHIVEYLQFEFIYRVIIFILLIVDVQIE
jgi:hypothetical protein